ncbi:mycofactocin biosynthesis peptidyl-dipeptidase MftE [Citricoccus sp. GCM10030269]|uniref:mycofactocin biosynthesis peptidyl-dipeptidase MftE n=1 Tax=Citricoccus sp. GCM10030269 TaxID=3273388 RepID=UPI00360FA76E
MTSAAGLSELRSPQTAVRAEDGAHHETRPRPAGTLIVPLGSIEQHGTHLPLGTDGIIAEALCRRVASGLTAADGPGSPWFLAPLIPFGSSGEHEQFPGTVSIGHAELGGYLVELARSATRWCPRIRFVTGHGGNAPALRGACRLLLREGRDVAWTGLDPADADAHAGHTETSLLLHLAPELVRMDLAAPGRLDPLEKILPDLVRDGVQAVSPTGVLGDPTTATAAEGAVLAEQACADLSHRLTHSLTDDGGRLA